MEVWHVVIEPGTTVGHAERFIWRINEIATREGPHELAAFGRAMNRADALLKVADAFRELAAPPQPLVIVQQPAV
jgi:hypothetical protein